MKYLKSRNLIKGQNLYPETAKHEQFSLGVRMGCKRYVYNETGKFNLKDLIKWVAVFWNMFAVVTGLW